MDSLATQSCRMYGGCMDRKCSDGQPGNSGIWPSDPWPSGSAVCKLLGDRRQPPRQGQHAAVLCPLGRRLRTLQLRPVSRFRGLWSLRALSIELSDLGKTRPLSNSSLCWRLSWRVATSHCMHLHGTFMRLTLTLGSV